MKRLLLALAATLATTLAPLAQAQPYPSRPVRVVVPFAPGGPADLLGRLAAQAIADGLGQAAVVENKVGAAGNIGVDLVAKAPPDGYTLGIVPVGNIAVNPSLFSSLPYKASELAPVALLATVENVLVVHAGLPVANLRELLALARQKPESISFASPGAGSQAHLAGELLALDGNVKLVHVPYKGTGPALNDLVGGQVSMMFAQASAAVPFIQQGRLRPIGLASLKRSTALPQVPTVAEQGLAGFEAVSWYALMAPAGTPRDVVDKLHEQMTQALARPDTREKFAALGMEAGTGTPEQLAARIAAESVRWSDVVRKRNIKPD
ncbi:MULTISPECIES: tripartite tricarboxylate transporter substrate binding protein [Ramlibacter]|uniref:Tripartite tricarboxylate transporter substrate binding protein n=1 Tax=Ramlibacter pinisoli TaxID=2682844 RepID=A0A6N8J053_9BURK|nr:MULTISPECIES: tripartite tricarboxylate transporter substrate binding protein [Ramlibacter]MBA2962729.1 tripartite tricarboxylate transporter substrate binding protein [Ramlibacter sp. CGMCC 1.13660]MVQ32671.1 tripartite tricarboxylate transporter substrate binding protein [Ramlibacter pinisoli]